MFKEYVKKSTLKMTKREYYAQMKELFTWYFGRDFKQLKVSKIKLTLERGYAPEINELYQNALYKQRPFSRGCSDPRPTYNIWDYDRLDNLLKHL